MREPDPDSYTWRTSRDAAQRMFDTLQLHHQALTLLDKVEGQHWVAIRLSDGGSDGIAYDTRWDAIRHQLTPTQCGYMPIKPGMPGLAGCDVLLWYWRGAYERGWRPDENTPHLHLPMKMEITRAAQRGRRRN